MPAFCDLPIDARFRFLDAIAAAGGDWLMYHGDAVQVCIPRIDWTPGRAEDDIAAVSIRQSADGIRLIDAIAAECHLERVGEPMYFPLGSDWAPDRQRHDGPAYCGYGRYGYWYHASYRPRQGSV
jgi:hypothetical protein